MNDPIKNEVTSRPETAIHSSSVPCNPRPFLKRIIDLVNEKGNPAMKTPEVRACLWIVNQMTFGQLARVDLGDEWSAVDWLLSESSAGNVVKKLEDCKVGDVVRVKLHSYSSPEMATVKSIDKDTYTAVLDMHPVNGIAYDTNVELSIDVAMGAEPTIVSYEQQPVTSAYGNVATVARMSNGETKSLDTYFEDERRSFVDDNMVGMTLAAAEEVVRVRRTDWIKTWK